MKTPRPIKLAEEYCNKRHGFNTHEFDAFLAGYDAVIVLIEEELKLIQANKSFSTIVQNPNLEIALQSLLDKIEGL